MSENKDKRKILDSRRRLTTIRTDPFSVPLIFAADGLFYKADTSVVVNPAVVQGVELTAREDMLVRLILADRQGSVYLALVNEALPEQWVDLKKAFNDLLDIATELDEEEGSKGLEHSFPSRRAEIENIRRWQERFK